MIRDTCIVSHLFFDRVNHDRINVELVQAVGREHEFLSSLQVHLFDAPQQNRKRFARPFEPSHIVLFCPCNMDASRTRATQVDLGVHLDSCLQKF
jgi:hypothetical protein